MSIVILKFYLTNDDLDLIFLGVISNKGQFPAADGEAANFLTTGPMCRYADDLLPMYEIMAIGSDTSKLKLDQQVGCRKVSPVHKSWGPVECTKEGVLISN